MSRLLRNAFMFVVYAYLYIPIIILVTNSFNEDRYGLSWKGFSWNWYERLFNNDTLIQAAFHSVTIAFFAATLATIVGGLTAIALYRYRFRGKQAVSGMLFIVMMSPDIVMAVSLLALFMVVGISLGFWSLLLAHVTFCLPYVTVTIFSRLNGFDARMLEAAKDLGASEVTILRKIVTSLAPKSFAASSILASKPFKREKIVTVTYGKQKVTWASNSDQKPKEIPTTINNASNDTAITISGDIITINNIPLTACLPRKR